MTKYQILILAASLVLLHIHFVLTSPTNPHKVKRQTPESEANAFLEGVGDLVTGLITTGLRSVAALITSGSEASQKMAVAVGTAALPPLLNVSRAFTRVQQSSTRLINSTQSAFLPESGALRNVTRRIAQGIQPAIGLVGQSVNNTLRSSSGSGLLGLFGNRGNTTRVNPNDSDIPDGIDDIEIN